MDGDWIGERLQTERVLDALFRRSKCCTDCCGVISRCVCWLLSSEWAEKEEFKESREDFVLREELTRLMGDDCGTGSIEVEGTRCKGLFMGEKKEGDVTEKEEAEAEVEEEDEEEEEEEDDDDDDI